MLIYTKCIRLFLTGLVLSFCSLCFAQKQKDGTNKDDAYLMVGIKRIPQNQQPPQEFVKSTLRFDHEANFYSYDMAEKWEPTDSYQLTIRSKNLSGFLYIFDVDGQGGVSILKTISVDTLSAGRVVAFADSVKGNLLKFYGKAHLSIWLANKEVKRYKNAINGIELTYGNFIIRNKTQIQPLFKIPDNNFKFSKKRIGVYIKPEILKATQSFTIPVIIDFNIKKLKT